jgi:hypothetical protein
MFKYWDIHCHIFCSGFYSSVLGHRACGRQAERPGVHSQAKLGNVGKLPFPD